MKINIVENVIYDTIKVLYSTCIKHKACLFLFFFIFYFFMEPYKNGYSLLSTKKGYAIVTSQITRIWYILEPFFLRVYSTQDVSMLKKYFRRCSPKAIYSETGSFEKSIILESKLYVINCGLLPKARTNCFHTDSLT